MSHNSLSLSVDVNSQVTVLIKAFLRYKELNVLISSIRQNYPEIKIIIADDSLQPEKVVGDNIEQYIMPPGTGTNVRVLKLNGIVIFLKCKCYLFSSFQGWFAGRNLAVSQVTTKYFLWVDDDFVFLNETRIESFLNIMEAVPELDLVIMSNISIHLTDSKPLNSSYLCMHSANKKYCLTFNLFYFQQNS